jgi:hypothetical protein
VLRPASHRFGHPAPAIELRVVTWWVLALITSELLRDRRSIGAIGDLRELTHHGASLPKAPFLRYFATAGV